MVPLRGVLQHAWCFLFTRVNWAVIAGVVPYSTKHADSIDLELEVDPLNVDHFSCTPLVRRKLIYPRAVFPGWPRDIGRVLCVVPL